MSWLVGRAGPDDFRLEGGAERQAEVCEWLRTLGVEPENMTLHIAVTQKQDGQHTLHLSELIRKDGHAQVDVATDRVASAPVCIPVDKGSWPAWLNEMNLPNPAES